MQRPPMQVLQKIVNSCQSLCINYKPQATLQSQCQQLKINELLPLLDLNALGLTKKQKIIKNNVGICNLIDNYPLRISVYFLPLGYTMKLHNHPSMEVISYVLQGKIRSAVFTHQEADLYSKRVETMTPGSIAYIEGLKTTHQNLHQFHALQPSYFLDIIFPDYDTDRNCIFYQEIQTINPQQSKLKEINDFQVDFDSLN